MVYLNTFSFLYNFFGGSTCKTTAEVQDSSVLFCDTGARPDEEYGVHPHHFLVGFWVPQIEKVDRHFKMLKRGPFLQLLTPLVLKVMVKL